jgi:methionine-rich copper-binding protein CopC
VLACVAPAVARAHAILVDSQPAPQSHIRPGHLDVQLRFNSRLDAARSKVTVQAGDGPQQRIAISDDGGANRLGATLDVRPGRYTLRWQVLSVDGHVTRGTVPFTVDPD